MQRTFFRYISLLLIGIVVSAGLLGLWAATTRAAEVIETPVQAQVEDETPSVAPGRPQGRMLVRALVWATADVCEIELSEVKTGVRDGQSLAQIAEAHGKTGTDVVDAVVAKLRERLDQAVQSGRLSQDRADQVIEQVTARATDLVNHSDLGERIEQQRQQRSRTAIRPFLVQLTAEQTGLPTSEVIQRLRNGESLAEIAESAGQSGDAIVDAAVEQFREQASRVVNNSQ